MSTGPAAHAGDGVADFGVNATGQGAVAIGRMNVAGDLVHGDKIVNRPTKPRKVSWPVRVGQVPEVVAQFQHRPGVDLAARFADSNRVGTVTFVLAGLGGTGKTQLAAHYARSTEDPDLRVWVTAASRAAVITGYAAAAAAIDIAVSDSGDEQAAAQAFLNWVERTKKSWVVVLDDLADPADLDGWWPSGQSGQVIVTTCRRDDDLADHGLVLDVDVFDPEEADAYLTARLADWQSDDIAGVARDLGFLPLALGQAAAYMLHRGGGGLRCSQYRIRLSDEAARLNVLLPSDARAGGYRSQETARATVATTWGVSIEAANTLPPPGAARAVLAIASLLDPNGIPLEVFTTASCIQAGQRLIGGERRFSGDDFLDALDHLARFSLADMNPDSSGQRWVRVHALVQRAVREALSQEGLLAVGWAVADGLHELWPPDDHRPDVAEYLERLRGNVTFLRDAARFGLFQDAEGAHPVLFAVARSLEAQPRQAVEFTQALAADCESLLGREHPDTLTSRGYLAHAHLEAGSIGKALPLAKSTVTARSRLLGTNHPDTLISWLDLGRIYVVAGQLTEAVPMLEATLAAFERKLGTQNRAILSGQLELAHAYVRVQRIDDALTLSKATLTDCERLLGPEDPHTLTSRNNLALVYQEAGQLDEALPLFEATLIDRKRLLGTNHPQTLASLLNLARAYEAAGRLNQALPLFKVALTGFEQQLGPKHPDTLVSRTQLAIANDKAGQVTEALGLFEEIYIDSNQVLGPEHPDTLASRHNLALVYRKAGRPTDATALQDANGAGLTDSLIRRQP